MRVLLITHADKALEQGQYGFELTNSLREMCDLEIAFFEDMATPSARAAADLANVSLASVDSVLVWVRFRHRVNGAPFDWTGFGGRRVWIEQDAWLNFEPSSPYHEAYPPVFKRDRFDLMIATGKATCEMLTMQGISAVWIPKGFSANTFRDLGHASREGVCTFGTAWPSRRAMIHRVRRRGLEVTDVSGPFSTLNGRLNDYSSAMVCNMRGVAPYGKLGRGVARVWPEFVRLQPAIEPMIKTFEVAGAGCAPIIDNVVDLDDLGFVHGQNCLIYESFDQAAELAQHTTTSEQRRLGRSAGQLVRERHTWAHRARSIVDALHA